MLETRSYQKIVLNVIGELRNDDGATHDEPLTADEFESRLDLGRTLGQVHSYLLQEGVLGVQGCVHLH